MQLTDTHAHLDYPDFAADLPAVLAAARGAGVRRIVTIGTTLESCRRALALADAHDEVFAVVGIHPTEVQRDPEGDFTGELRAMARHPKVVALGETGLDYHHLPGAEILRGEDAVFGALQAGTAEETEASIADAAAKSAQAAAFRMHLDLAVELGLNVVIHQREAWEDTCALLAPYAGRVRGVFHCFGGSPEQAEDILAQGHLVSFTGIVTFKNAATVQATARAVPRDGFMVETDCPYLAPVPHRGKRCEPAHARLVAEKIAALRGCSLEDVAAATESTAGQFFRWRH